MLSKVIFNEYPDYLLKDKIDNLVVRGRLSLGSRREKSLRFALLDPSGIEPPSEDCEPSVLPLNYEPDAVIILT